MKLLQFNENVRPAYYGTFTQRSQIINGRRPFAKDEAKLDYDIDSEAEWEPEGEGEDIVSGDEDDDDPNMDMIDPEDAGWLVPEGYLSDNEGVEGEDCSERGVDKPLNTTSSTKRVAIRKVILGPFFEGETEEDVAMKPFETQFFVDLPEGGFNPFYKEPTSHASTTAATPAAAAAAAAAATATTTTHVMANDFTNEHTTALINVINEKSGDSIPNLITEAKTNWLLKDVSKRQLEAKIKNIAVKEKRGSDTKPTWYIKESSSS
ncbi:chromatin assembly factor 1 subunit A-domain-containing protein [Pilaira anomala]|nr:chromatin assembly factor 1 subunit A-domain-containing protein [Pilaira anomala]